MDLDLTELLADWAYTPGQINVRLIQGQDGARKVQVRLDLGILQMNMEGRPDGLRPHSYPSLLDYHQARIDAQLADPAADLPGESDGEDDIDSEIAGGEAEDTNDDDSDTSDTESGERPIRLSEDECRALREEAAQYYHRYVALLVLEEFDAVVRDTTRNLRVLDLCNKHAANESDRNALEQFRPYIMMMRSRALASQALSDSEPKAAIAAIDDGLDGLRRYFAEAGEGEHFEESPEVQMLRGMREALVPKLPVSQGAELKERLKQAVDQENYELAAILRDELKMLRDRPTQA
ncbi:MAG: UvrB/UvrC motif-containing protein [Planctomycetota bacterium]